VDSLNIEPQTFCGFIEVIEALVLLVQLKLQKKTLKNKIKTCLKSTGIQTRKLHIKHPKP